MRAKRRATRFLEPTIVTSDTATATTDARGKFTVEVTGRGWVNVSFHLPAIVQPLAWVNDNRAVELTGKQRYAIGTHDVSFDGPCDGDCGELPDKLDRHPQE